MSSGFRDGVSAAVASGPHGESGFWFFKGDQAVKADARGEKREYGPANITATEAWPALAAFGRTSTPRSSPVLTNLLTITNELVHGRQ
ncbi:hypothetical protein ACIQNG_33625 [Streptomyces sp. NPDC091377]|uniref:hypothetical protein n=1 Tax=Streptomyces sp. NPDC091377 TaxID=3365995 RepID=UPI003827DE71